MARQLLKPVKDRNGLVAELYEAVLKTNASENPFRNVKSDKLTEVKITGAVAVGISTTKVADQDLSREIFFRKQGDGWRIDLGFESPPAQPK